MNNEMIIRTSCFLGTLIVIAAWELILPRRALTTSKCMRWLSNLGIVFVNTVAARIVLPVLPVSMALIAGKNHWGLFHYMNVSYPLAVITGVLVLDLVIYIQHVMFHAMPLLWRLHMMHHADLDIDLTTGLRFHPIEIIISMGIKLSAIAVFGPPVLAVIIFEIVLNSAAMFNHSNMYLPEKIDSILRLILVTPDMHRVHHSVTIRETNSNFGFNIPWWDRIFGTYRAQPVAGHIDMTIGLAQFRDPKRLTLPWMLALPFIGEAGNYSINRWGREPARKR